MGCRDQQEVKRLIEELRQRIPNVESNIFSAGGKVSLGAVLGWRLRDEGPFTSFLDEYEDEAPEGLDSIWRKH